MRRIRDWLADFMYGRNGNDTISRTCILGGLVSLVLSYFVLRSTGIFVYIAIALLIYSYFRMFSRNIPKRQAENERFVSFFSNLFRPLRNGARHAKDKDHAYFKCPACHQSVRVPKGKGKIMIRCPKCQNQFVKRT